LLNYGRYKFPSNLKESNNILPGKHPLFPAKYPLKHSIEGLLTEYRVYHAILQGRPNGFEKEKENNRYGIQIILQTGRTLLKEDG
jgi:hypothetical protein